MNTTSPLFDINKLTNEEQTTFRSVVEQMKKHFDDYLEYKKSLNLRAEFNIDQENNEWQYEIHRHLRGRKWNEGDTVQSLLDMIMWRKQNNADSILEDSSIQHQMNRFRAIATGAHHGFTKYQQPLCIEKTGRVNVNKILTEFTQEELIRCHIYWIEFLCQLARLRSQRTGKHIESFCMIFDIKGCNLKTRKALHIFKEYIGIDQRYYPERLGHMFVVNSPKIVTILWNIIKLWLDPVTQQKFIFAHKSGSENELLEYIDSDQLPSEYGGTCDSCPTSPNCIPVSQSSTEGDDDDNDQ